MPLNSLIALIVMLLLLMAVIFQQFFLPGMRLRRLRRQAFPPAWEQSLQRSLPIYAGLPPDLRIQLKNLIKQFIADKRFVGCGGQQIDDEVRVTIAANACLLLLNRQSDCYPDLHSVLVYPSTFVVSHARRDAAGVVSEQASALLGESWSNGRIILAWDDVQRGVANFSDGHNVVLHEFAHELDHEDGATNGAPLLRTRGAYKSWAEVFAVEYAELQEQAASGEASLMDQYGATDPAEFFAVATETFFEKPVEMQLQHQALYQQLLDFYQVDPAQWLQTNNNQH